MYNSRITIGSKARQNNAYKVSLGNNAPRYNSEVAVQRKKYLMSSTYHPSHTVKIVKMPQIG